MFVEIAPLCHNLPILLSRLRSSISRLSSSSEPSSSLSRGTFCMGTLGAWPVPVLLMFSRTIDMILWRYSREFRFSMLLEGTVRVYVGEK